MDTHMIAIDCGTQSVRALLFNHHGHLIHKVKRDFEPYFSHKPGYAEQNPDLYYEKIRECLKQLSEEQIEVVKSVKGLCMTILRDTGVYLDVSYQVVRPSMLWLDQRVAKCETPLAFKDRILFKAIGMTRAVDITRKLSKVNWIKENEPELWDKTAHYVLLPAYLQYKLTGIMVDSVANQIGHVPFNYKTQSWPKSNSDYRWSVFGIEKHKLYELNKPGDIVGKIHSELALYTGLPEDVVVISGGSDKGCETLGVGCINLNQASISFGTTATVQTMSPKYFEPILFMPAYPATIPHHYNPEVQIFRGYWMIRWFKQEFASREQQEAIRTGVDPEVLLNACLKTVPPGSEGLILQPYWTPGLKNPDAKGSIIGFNDSHTRAHFYRAIVEGINYGLLDGLKKIESKSKVKIERIMVSGGGSQSDEICQITADMFNRPVFKGETYEAAGLGAAIIGFVGLGVYETFEEAVTKMVRQAYRFEPSENAKLYDKLYNRIYKRIYEHLRGLYSELNQILEMQEDDNARKE